MLLLMHLYASGGKIEYTPKMICKLTGLSRYKLPKFMPVFDKHLSNNGEVFWSDRVLEQLEATAEKGKKNSERASMAARKRWGIEEPPIKSKK